MPINFSQNKILVVVNNHYTYIKLVHIEISNIVILKLEELTNVHM